MSKVVVATGVFDVVHPGHILFLNEAKKLGDRLVVIVARDKNVAKWKREPHIPEEQRRMVVEAFKPVDEAVLGEEAEVDFYKPILDIKPDILVLGPNQKIDEVEISKNLTALGLETRVVRIDKIWKNPLASSGRIINKIKNG
ncbi:MAG: adenylyltransferase/cytidyltransferase family protein [Nanoarchaeota archaeon]